MTGISRALAAIVAFALVASCTPAAPAEQTYPLEPRAIRAGEKPLRIKGTDDGAEFQLIGLSTFPTLVGSHAEWSAEGKYVRIRLVVANSGRTTVLFDTNRQLLVLADGTTLKPDEPAMLTKRQPDKFQLGAGVRVEFDLYYDVPEGTRVTALRTHGGPTLTDMRDKEGTDVPIDR